MFPWTMTQSTISVIIDGDSYSTTLGSKNFQDVKKAVLEGRWEDVRRLLTPGKAIQAWSEGAFVYEDGVLTCGDDEIPPTLFSRILELLQENHKPTPMVRFWERLKNNTSKRSMDMLYAFLEHASIPIDEDGYVLAYKGVREDYYDKHSGKFLNTPGSKFRMARNKISDDPNSACAEGFHVGSLSYANNFGRRVVVCKVDPADVVCVPYDSNQEKVRVCAYEVVGNMGPALPNTVATRDFYDFLDELDEEPDEFEDPEERDDESEEVETLGSLTLEELRKVAKDRGIKNVKAIKGGKSALLAKLQDVDQPQAGEFQVKKGYKPSPPDKDLNSMSMDELRKYASSVLKIVGAYKIPGGKSALVEAIRKAM